ncbi:DUF7343 domain-containing protein [Halohasta litorea]|uniref:Helix-turn-helix domain-containing protein n=1 Tax=Halohasta litorea TaxID=869891 RepID=A0ABD6D4L4_9EURY|nr:helix-turn-helix domain-containing protein [Halohasta litorea]MEA1931485.1 helix-turn-helix domain-containing protein [Euryarchaeota archaeon]
MSPRGALPILVGLCVCLLTVSSIAAVTTAQQPELVVEQHGSGIALEDESTTYLWQYSTYSMSVTFSATSDEIHTVCLSQYDEDSVEQPLVCQWTAVDTEGSTTVTLTQSEWPEDISGEETLAIEIYTGRNTNGEPIEQVLQPVYIIEKDGDLDGNGLTNEREIELGTHPADADSDGDGLTDGIEVMLGTDPRDSATPYRIGVVTVGSLTAGAFGLLLVAGRLMMGLQALGVSTGRDGDEEPVSERAETPTFEAPIRDEERIRRLLSAHEGRLKQSQIVEATDWSKSKVSRLLSSMEDDGEITRVRLGRENLVCLRGHEPADVTPSWKDTDESGSPDGGTSP